MILDAERPWQVVCRTSTPLLEPETADERSGIVPNVVFPTAIEDDRWRALPLLRHGRLQDRGGPDRRAVLIDRSSTTGTFDDEALTRLLTDLIDRADRGQLPARRGAHRRPGAGAYDHADQHRASGLPARSGDRARDPRSLDLPDRRRARGHHAVDLRRRPATAAPSSGSVAEPSTRPRVTGARARSMPTTSAGPRWSTCGTGGSSATGPAATRRTSCCAGWPTCRPPPDRTAAMSCCGCRPTAR